MSKPAYTVNPAFQAGNRKFYLSEPTSLGLSLRVATEDGGVGPRRPERLNRVSRYTHIYLNHVDTLDFTSKNLSIFLLSSSLIEDIKFSLNLLPMPIVAFFTMGCNFLATSKIN